MEPSVSRFTPPEGGARLAATARVKNSLVTEHTSFIATRLLYEEAYQIRGSLSSGKKRSLYITLETRVEYVCYSLKILTDLITVGVTNVDEVQPLDIVEENQVVVCTSAVAQVLFEREVLRMCHVNVIVIDSCHLIAQDPHLRYLMKIYKLTEESIRPRILALTYPLFNLTKQSISECQKEIDKADTKENIDKNETSMSKDETEINKDEATTNKDETPILKDDTEINKGKTAINNDETAINKDETEINKDETEINKDETVINKDETEIEDEKRKDDDMSNESKETAECMRDDNFVVGKYENCDDFSMYEKMEWKIDVLESELCCKADLAEDIDGVKRLSMAVAKPKELIIEYEGEKDISVSLESYLQLESFMRSTVTEALQFFDEHRYDPTEIYGEDMYDEIKLIPDPTIEPKEILYQFLYILEQLGPYGADKAAFSLLSKLEKLKIKVPYERHFILLCVCTSVFVKIRAFADLVFSEYESEWDKIQKYCSPKILRFVEILEQFTPPNNEKNEINKNETDRNENDTNDKETGERNDRKQKVTAKAMLKEIESCNFLSLGDRIEDKINTLKTDLKELDDVTAHNEIEKNENEITKNENETAKNENETAKNVTENQQSILGFPKRLSFKSRVRGRVPRSVNRIQQLLLNPDALCGIVFVKEALMAKVLFMIIVELTRAHRPLSYICTQYCGGERPPHPLQPRDHDRHRRTQEEVLKKFRMHECNLLIATSLLEEGIDLPRCNLVLRWDIPISYRSYGLCRGRARAVRSTCVMMTSHTADMTSHAGEMTSDTEYMTHNLATYKELDQIVSRKCGCGAQEEPPQSEEYDADVYTNVVHPYIPSEGQDECCTSVNEGGTSVNEGGTSRNEGGTSRNEGGTSRNEDGSSKNECGISRNEGGTSVNEGGTSKNECGISKSECKTKKSDHENKIESFENISVHKNSYVNLNVNKNSISISNASVSELSEKLSEISVNKTNVSEILSENVASVDLSTAVALINRYCGKLPSDTFTRLSPQYWVEEVPLPLAGKPGTNGTAYISTLRLPLNCPVKYNIVGHPMPTRVLARRMVALQACRILHKSGELDDQLMPIGKENFKIVESSDRAPIELEIARPGSTKRRQYYYKRTARAFTNCEPIVDSTDADIENNPIYDPTTQPKTGRRNMLFLLSSRLCCGLPERYNTRGRRLHQPQQAPQALAILMATDNKDALSIPSFPVYTRSGEVRVCVCPVHDADVRVSPSRGRLVRRFMRFVFAEVLRVRRRDMTLKTEGSTHNNYYIVPTIKSTKPDGSTKIDVDWSFLELIYQYTEEKKNSDIEKPILWHQDEEEIENDNKQKAFNQSKQDVVSNQSKQDQDILNQSNQDKDILNQSNQDKDILNQSNQDKNILNQSKQDKDILNQSKQDKVDSNQSKENKDVLNQSNQVDVSNQSKQDIDSNQSKENTDELKLSNQNENILNTMLDSKYGNKRQKVVKKMDNPLLKTGEVFVFDPEKYKDAVVTPWYRNQDQPQFFLVAEICWKLSPDSAFPSDSHSSFRCYYGSKYGVELTQPNQPLLDVDHTSARLNLLTPRYVNRKGVALPVSSERTRRAKRDRLDQKQILVPELCRVHPFAAPLWFATVALPCVLYRINALLLADEIRRGVGGAVGLGLSPLPPLQWPPLDFGWTLAEVLSANLEKSDHKKDDKIDNSHEETDQSVSEDVPREKEVTDTVRDTVELQEVREKTINDILEEKEADMGFEIGTWSNEMASSIPENEFDDYLEPLPPNLKFCTSASGGTNWCDPIPQRGSYNPPKNYEMADSDCSYMSSDFDTDDTDMSGSDGETDSSGFWSENRSNAAMGVRIEYKTAHEAEAVDLEAVPKAPSSPCVDPESDQRDLYRHMEYITGGDAPEQYKEKFHRNVEKHRMEIIEKNLIINKEEPVKNILPETITPKPANIEKTNKKDFIKKLFPYGIEENSTEITLDIIEKNKRKLLSLLRKTLPESEIKKLNCFSMTDVDIDSKEYINEKVANVGFDSKEDYIEKVLNSEPAKYNESYMNGYKSGKNFDFDYQPELEGHPGPSPSIILQALTMSNANDGINLERLETIGDSFLKFAITAYLYCAHPTVHEGKLSHMRSKQVSNLNLYRLGRCRRLGARMIASKFEPHDNWLPPCHRPPHNTNFKNQNTTPEKKKMENQREGCFIPYNLITQHSIPDKSIADCVEALIGAYLIETGPRGALLFMSYLGIKVLPLHHIELPSDHHLVTDITHKEKNKSPSRSSISKSDSECESSQEDEPTEDMCTEQATKYGVGVLEPYFKDGKWYQPVYGALKAPPSPLLRYIADPDGELEQMLSGYDALERTLQYRFNDRSLLLQALTHASHQHNRLTDCYQRLEFLGDAILDYLITRHLYEDPRRHSPGALTDLRSALVNNTIFATLAVRHQLHKYFRHMSPGLNEVLNKYVRIQEENGHSISEEHYLIQEDEMEQAEDVEVPKALGDLFESVAGAIFLDSGMSLGAVWRSYVTLMGAELEAFSAAAPKSPVRELLEAEPDTAKFGKPERLADGRRVRVCVEVFGRGTFKGIGRNYRIAKGTAARCALRHLKKHKAC